MLPPFIRRRPVAARCAVATLLAAVSACAGGAGVGGGPEPATDAEWRALRIERPDPLEGAARVAVGDIEIVGSLDWPRGGVGAALGVSELVVTGLLQRRDIAFVERRRFERASAAERAGTRPPGHPPAGVSPGAEFIVHAVWVDRGASGSAIDVRLVRLASGDVAGATRVTLPSAPGAVAVARGIVAGSLEVLADLGRRPAWTEAADAANDPAAAGVSPEALDHFARGLAAEELFRWEEARRGYQAALRNDVFPEAAAALARTARLRSGGTIAES